MSEISIRREDAIKKMRLMKYCEIELPLIEHVAICEQAISEMEKLDGYETKLKNAYGECDNLLDVVVDGLVKWAEEREIGQPLKARLLTDDDVDLWEQSKSDREKLEKIEKILNEDCTETVQCPSCLYNYRDEDCISYRKVDLIDRILLEVENELLG